MQEGGLYVLPVDVVKGFWKGDGDLSYVVYEVYDSSEIVGKVPKKRLN